MIITFDLETIPAKEKPSLDEIEAPKNYKDEKKIKQYKEEKVEEEYRKQALKSLKGRLLCIGYAFDDEPAQCIMINPEDPNEYEMLNEFTELILTKKPRAIDPVFVGHNIKAFDILWLGHRALKYNLPQLWKMLPKYRYAKNLQDTAEIFAMTDFKSYFSLKDIADFLGIECKSDLSGDQVYDAWLAGEYERIKKYCIEDVETVREIYNRTQMQPKIEMDEWALP